LHCLFTGLQTPQNRIINCKMGTSVGFLTGYCIKLYAVEANVHRGAITGSLRLATAVEGTDLVL
jgi:hypothetical protein